MLGSEGGGRMKENSFSAKRPVFLGAGVGRAETGPCLHVGACSYLARPPETLPGQPQAPNHPRSSMFWLEEKHPTPSLSHSRKPLGPFAKLRDIGSWKGLAPKRMLPRNQTTTSRGRRRHPEHWGGRQARPPGKIRK